MEYGIILKEQKVLLNLNIPCPFPQINELGSYKKNFFYLDSSNQKKYYLSTNNGLKKYPKEFEFIPAKNLLSVLTQSYLELIFKALHYQHYHQHEKYCSICGNPTHHIDLNEKKCSSCKKFIYPNISPCVISLIIKKNEVLLAQHKQFPPGKYSCIAGFIEPGENAEQAITREIKEEVGLTVNNIKYFGSQIWLFPNQFMLGFLTDYLAGDIICCPEELNKARWFNKKNLPALLPHPYSIARRMLNSFFNIT